MREIICERKKALKTSEMIIEKAPPFVDGLRVSDFLKFMIDRKFEDYLPPNENRNGK